MEKAMDDLYEYIEKREETELEVDPEAEIYICELKMCKSEREIKKYMEEFGWPNKVKSKKESLKCLHAYIKREKNDPEMAATFLLGLEIQENGRDIIEYMKDFK